MRSLLSTHLARNMSKSAKAEPVCQYDNKHCSSEIEGKGTQCINLGESSGYVFYPPVAVTDLWNNNKRTEEVYMITQGCYLISGIGDLYYPVSASSETTDDEYKDTFAYYLVSTKDAELNLNLEVNLRIESDMQVGTVEGNGFYIVNPNNFTVETEFNNKHLFYNTRPEKGAEEGSTKITDIYAGEFRMTFDKELQVSESFKATISGNDPGNIPQKVWKIVPGKLYTKDTPNDDLPEDSPGDGLSGGAIAGIVIACVVVVGVVVFCIVWFVVLKKSCGKKSDEPAA